MADKNKGGAKGFIPGFVSDRLVIGFLDFTSKLQRPKEDLIELHYEYNKDIWKTSKNKCMKAYKQKWYIEKQSELKGLLYGKGNQRKDKRYLKGRNLTAAENSCTVIAVYNALVSLCHGKVLVDLPDLIKTFEKRGIAYGGYYGTSVKAMMRFFENNKIVTEMYIGKMIDDDVIDDIDRCFDTFVMTAYNNKYDITDMIHTVCITKEKEGYVIHNEDGGKTYSSLKDAVGGFREGRGRVMMISGLGRPQYLE